MLAAAAAAAATTAIFGGNSHDVRRSAKSGAIGAFGVVAYPFTHSSGMAILDGVLAYQRGGSDGLEDFAGGFLGSLAGDYTAKRVINKVQGISSSGDIQDQQKIQQDIKTGKQETVQEVNAQKGNPTAVARGAKQIVSKVEDTSNTISEIVTPERVLGTAGRVAEASGHNVLAKSLKIAGSALNSDGPFSLAGGIAGGSAGFFIGTQAGVKVGFAIGSILGPQGAIAGVYIGYGIGGVAGGTAGAIYGSKAFSILDKPNYGEAY